MWNVFPHFALKDDFLQSHLSSASALARFPTALPSLPRGGSGSFLTNSGDKDELCREPSTGKLPDSPCSVSYERKPSSDVDGWTHGCDKNSYKRLRRYDSWSSLHRTCDSWTTLQTWLWPNQHDESAFNESMVQKWVWRDGFCHVLGAMLWLSAIYRLSHVHRGKDVLLGSLGAAQSAFALALGLFWPAHYLRWRKYIIIFIKISTACIANAMVVLPLSSLTEGLPAWVSVIPQCFVWNKVLMLLVISLGMPLLLRHHIVVHGIATAIVLSNNSRLCELTEVMLPGSLAVYNEVLGIVLQVSDPGDAKVRPVRLRHFGTSASCVAVQSSLQILFGFLLPTIILFLLRLSRGTGSSNRR